MQLDMMTTYMEPSIKIRMINRCIYHLLIAKLQRHKLFKTRTLNIKIKILLNNLHQSNPMKTLHLISAQANKKQIKLPIKKTQIRFNRIQHISIIQLKKITSMRINIGATKQRVRKIYFHFQNHLWEVEYNGFLNLLWVFHLK